MPGLPHLTPVADPAVTGTRPGLPAVTPRSAAPAGPASATAAGPGAPSRPEVAPRRRPRPDPPTGAAAARLLGLPDDPGPRLPRPRPAPPSSGDLLLFGDDADRSALDERDLDDDLDVSALDEDLALADGGDRVLWSATGPAGPVPEPRVGQRDVSGVATIAAPDGDERGARVPAQDEPGPHRVRVVLSERKGVARPVRNVVELQESGAVGDLLRSNLIGAQLGVALRFAAGGGLVLAALPLLFALFPVLGHLAVFGLRVPWLLLGLLAYPFLFGLGWWFTHVAERVEQHFADQVQD